MGKCLDRSDVDFGSSRFIFVRTSIGIHGNPLITIIVCISLGLIGAKAGPLRVSLGSV